MPIYYKKVSESESSHFLTDISSVEDNHESDSVPAPSDSTKVGRTTERTSVSSESKPWSESELDVNSIELQTPLVDNDLDEYDSKDWQRLETKHGPIWIHEQTNDLNLPLNSPTILTLHDLGLNHRTNFAHFFASSETKLLLKGFRIIHLTLPGQQDNADRLPFRYHFPTMQQLSEVIDFALTWRKVESFVGFGQGIGANLLLRFALRRPEAVRGLILIHATADRASWSEWFYQRRNIRNLKDEQQAGLSPAVLDYIVWSQFGRIDEPRNPQLAAELRGRLRVSPLNSYNLAGLIEAWLSRDMISLHRSSQSIAQPNMQTSSIKQSLSAKLSGSNPYLSRSLSIPTSDAISTNVKCDVLLLTGQQSPHLNDVEQLFARLPPQSSSCIRFPDCANPIEEQSAKSIQAIALFLQGLGHSLRAFQRRQSLRAGMSMPSLCLLPTN